jgi:hypothetical protein
MAWCVLLNYIPSSQLFLKEPKHVNYRVFGKFEKKFI